MRVFSGAFYFFLLIYGLCLSSTFGYVYQKYTEGSHIIHVVTLKKGENTFDLVKANDGKGRETLSSMAARTKAKVAVNAGFFEIGGKKDGEASLTLVIKGKIYTIRQKKQPLLILTEDTLSIIEGNPKDYLSQTVSMVAGIPLLLEHGEVVEALKKQISDFYTKPHARTAVGIKSNGDVVIVVAEHGYLKDITAMTMGDVQAFVDEFSKTHPGKNAKTLTLAETKKFLKEEFTSKTGPKGLTLLELATFMQKLGCVTALNLDGGGSSTLWIEGKVVNHTVGDCDEGEGTVMERPLSDALIIH